MNAMNALNATQIHDLLLALHTRIVEVEEAELYTKPNLFLGLYQKPLHLDWQVTSEYSERMSFQGKDFEEVFAAANAYLDGLPSKTEREVLAFRRKLSELIDKAPKHLDIAGLIETSKALASNALTMTPTKESEDAS